MTDEVKGSTNPAAPAQSSRKRWRWLLLPLVLLIGIAGFNLALVHLPAQSALADDSRNERADIAVYHRWGVSPSQIVFDIRGVEDEISRADITRMLFQTAEAFKDRDYEWVILAHKGQPKFKLSGDYFREIGESFSYQNPVFLMRKLPQNVQTLDGRQAFASYTGGMFGVLGGELEDLNAFHDEWWTDSEIYGL